MIFTRLEPLVSKFTSAQVEALDIAVRSYAPYTEQLDELTGLIFD